ncbi:hypothetical protein [Nitrobacter winogradskyi]|uniref:Uncharacterized protein n=2 Tax=Nitrobacter winogradskyi TaxID=913 RepID=A0ACC6AD59_NITWI|nr:hypothetical protein [Nitrobacter winogradskyi]MCP1997714.1 hypothetical protein [Nitrobacter winogradskyi]GEC14719.1 hypothetical protein NWI01_06110 [Nitrobacter winogradskyi]
MRIIWNLKLAAAAAVMAGLVAVLGSHTASAAPLSPAAIVAPAGVTPDVEQVQYYGYGRRYYRPRYGFAPRYGFGPRYGYGRGYYAPRRFYGPRYYAPRRFYRY